MNADQNVITKTYADSSFKDFAVHARDKTLGVAKRLRESSRFRFTAAVTTVAITGFGIGFLWGFHML